jgi:hypothetical protein
MCYRCSFGKNEGNLSVMRALFATVAIISGLASAASASTIVLQDDFNYGSTTQLSISTNFLAPNWTASPTIDYLATGSSFGGLCQNTGGCLDLDGSSNNAGVLSSVVSFAAGTYDLAFQMFGNGRGAASDSVTITLGSYTLVLSNIASGDDVSQTVHFTTTGGNLSFANAGGDNVGAILSSVTLTAVPLPAGGLLLLGGLGGLTALRRRKSV